MLVAIDILVGLIIVAGLIALESKRLKNSTTLVAVMGFIFVIASFLLGSAEVGIGSIVVFGILTPLLFQALKSTTDKDSTITPKSKTTHSEIFVLISAAAFTITFLIISFSLFEGLPPLAPSPIESHIGLSIIREVIVLLAALAGTWAIIRKTGRQDK
jgi:hypothetical protein